MNGQVPHPVTCELDLRLVVAGESSLPVSVELRYDAGDPYAVHATFRTGEEPVRWVFARDLLAEGVTRPVGDGDVRVWPSRERGLDVVLVGLSSPDGAALLEAPAALLVEYLRRTYACVPEGRESVHLDLDSAIERLFDEVA